MVGGVFEEVGETVFVVVGGLGGLIFFVVGLGGVDWFVLVCRGFLMLAFA